MLIKYETETTITWNDENKESTVYTCNKALIRKLDRLCVECPDFYKLKNFDEYSKTYSVLKKLISFRRPKIMTEEQKEIAKLRMAKFHEKQ